MGVVGVGGLGYHGRPEWGRNPGEEWGASSPLQRSSVAPEGLDRIVCWVHYETIG